MLLCLSPQPLPDFDSVRITAYAQRTAYVTAVLLSDNLLSASLIRASPIFGAAQSAAYRTPLIGALLLRSDRLPDFTLRWALCPLTYRFRRSSYTCVASLLSSLIMHNNYRKLNMYFIIFLQFLFRICIPKIHATFLVSL